MVCRGERKEIIVWSDKIQIVVCDIGLSSLLIKKNQLPVDEPVVYRCTGCIYAAKKVKSNCHSISLTIEALWATLLDNSEYKGDMFNDMQTLQGPHSLTLCSHPLPNNYR